MYTAGRQRMPAEPATHSSRGQNLHGNTIQAMYAPIMSLIMVVTQKGMCLDSRTTNHAFPCMMAQGVKCATFMSNEMQTIQQTKAQFPSPIQGTRHVCKMQCNLDIQAKDATWHGKTLMQACKQTRGDANG